MKSKSKILVTVALSAWMAVASALAQTNPTTTTPTEGTRVGKVVEPSPLTPQDSVTAVVRPKRTERPDLPPEVLARIERFKREAQAYLDREQALKKQLQGANDQERARIRDQMRALREQWLERTRSLQEEFRDRQKELIEKLPGHREVLESIRDTAKDAAREATTGTHDRRGQD